MYLFSLNCHLSYAGSELFLRWVKGGNRSALKSTLKIHQRQMVEVEKYICTIPMLLDVISYPLVAMVTCIAASLKEQQSGR